MYYLFNAFNYTSYITTGTGPEPLYDILLEAGFDEPHGKVVGKLWANEAASYMGKLKSRTLGSKTLIETNYHLNVIMSDSLQSQRHDPTSLFEFTLSNDSDNNNAVDVVSNEGGNKKDKAGEKICVEFDHSELFSLFTNLGKILLINLLHIYIYLINIYTSFIEKIQSQLDGLSGSK